MKAEVEEVKYQQMKAEAEDMGIITSNTQNWKPCAVQEAIEIAKELGLDAWEGTNQPTSEGEGSYPVLMIAKSRTDLREFWKTLNSRIPEYWKRD